MAATVLNSPRAVGMGIYVVRAFITLREFLASNKELARRLLFDQRTRQVQGTPVSLGRRRSNAPASGSRCRCSGVSLSVVNVSESLNNTIATHLTLDLAIDLGPEQYDEYRKPHPGKNYQR